MDLKGKKIILGSHSPRRQELLSGLGIDFTIDTGNTFEEVFPQDIPHSLVPSVMSEGKSFGFHRPLEKDEILLTSDTMVLCGSKMMGKPHSPEEAASMLRALSGRWHEVVTAITLRDCNRHLTASDTARVHFRELTEEEISYYIERYRPFDKAGAYGIQEWIGYVGITGIEGSFFTIMGLPVHLVYSSLLEFIG
ncbi:MAG: septum formation protein Maf [Bacteroidales bacterium]|nr:septum formation protein Maf [Bacteroidales bacterium]